MRTFPSSVSKHNRHISRLESETVSSCGVCVCVGRDGRRVPPSFHIECSSNFEHESNIRYTWSSLYARPHWLSSIRRVFRVENVHNLVYTSPVTTATIPSRLNINRPRRPPGDARFISQKPVIIRLNNRRTIYIYISIIYHGRHHRRGVRP